MKTLSLNGAWKFRAREAARHFAAPAHKARRWMPASVPGTVHTDLMECGLLSDPFYRMQENDAQWVEGVDWEYRRQFEVPAELLTEQSVELVAGGLDTFAEIRLNGHVVGKSANMFVEHRFPVKRHLREGRNVLEVRFASPVRESKRQERRGGRLKVALESHRVYARKAQYSFSWDWGPKLTTSGIWRGIALEAYSEARLAHPCAKVLSLTAQEAVVAFSCDVHRRTRKPLQLRLFLGGPDRAVEYTQQVRQSHVRMRIRIPNPRLWWPNGHGDHPLYTAVLTLLCGTDVLDEQQVHFGIRTVRLLQEKDACGRSFVVEVNGRKIFAKGADWIPSDSFIPRTPHATYNRLLRMAKDAHMNMIRVWGGGFYEEDIFYDLCDRFGLMVWQDFMFACGEYPETRHFLRQIESEATKALRRLRNHPSIVLWCGNNECEWLYCTENPGKTPDDMRGAKIFRDLLPAVVRREDGTRPYWRSSPFGKGSPNAESNGNHHQWNVWSQWKDYPEYEKNEARFVSEFGFQGPASVKTLREITVASDRTVQSRVLEHHNKQVEGPERLLRFLAAHHTLPSSLEDFVFKGQLVQAEALKCAVEHWRRRKYKTAGALFWQLNDCWPVISWSVIDSRLRPKAAYYFTRRFYAPLLVSFKRVTGGQELWLTSDLECALEGTVEVSLLSFSGRRKWVRRKAVRLAPDDSVCLMRLPHESAGDPARTYMLARFAAQGGLVAENRFFFAEPKHLVLPDPSLSWSVEHSPAHGISVTVRARGLARGVWLEVEGAEALFEDNAFDLDPGSEKTVQCLTDLPGPLIKRNLKVRSLP